MEKVTLSGTDLSVSRLGLGTMTFGSQTVGAAAASMVDLCLDRNVNFIDTASVYNAGRSETILGNILRGRREKVILASKIGIKVSSAPIDTGLSRDAIFRQVEASLHRLGTDYLDVLYLHQPDYAIPLEETLEAIDRLAQQGKLRYIGVSNYAAWQLCRMLWLAEARGYRQIAVVQAMYSLIARNIEEELLPMCQALGLSTVVYNPLAGGLLTGKHKEALGPAPGTRLSDNMAYHDRYWHRENFAALEQLAHLAKQEGSSMIRLSFSWLLHHTPANCVLVGASGLSQLEENLDAACGGPLAPRVLSGCNDVWRKVRSVAPKYFV